MERSDKLDQFLAALLTAQPAPPRKIHPKDFLRVTFVNQTIAVFAGMGLVASLFAIYLNLHGSIVNQPVSSSDRWVSVFCILMACLMFGAPLFGAARTYRALRDGSLVDSLVLSVSVAPPAYPGTFSAMKNGKARGVRRIYFSSVSIDVPFGIDRPWAMQIKEGSHIELLVDPVRKKALLSIRLLPM